MKNRFLSTTKMNRNYFETKANQLIDTGIKYGIDYTLKKFGKEYLFQWDEDSNVINEIIDKFIKKYDKRFEDHIIRRNQDYASIINKQFIIAFNKNTFAYIATGNKISNTEERFLLNSNISGRDMYIYIFGKYAKKVIKVFEKLTHDIYCSNELGLFNVDCSKNAYGKEDGKPYESLDVSYTKLSIRTLDTLFFSNNEKEIICNHINKFNDNKIFYTSKQLLYKTGILLYGEPGTGKSSLVKALASTYNRSIVNINMSNLQSIDLVKLTQSINIDDNRQYIILMEDIDTLFLNREDGSADKEDRAVINKLLQFLDSNTSPTNVIFIATTNHLERLDVALLREGRFDLKVEVKPLKDKECIEFGTSFTLSDKAATDLVKSLHKEFPDKKFINQSLLQARILGKIENRSNEKVKELYGVMEE